MESSTVVIDQFAPSGRGARGVNWTSGEKFSCNRRLSSLIERWVMSTLDSNTWKISYNNANHCGMMELANTPTRPPWRPAASSITAAKENNVPVPQRNDLGSKPKSEDLAIPPQYMSVTDLLAAMPTRQRLPKAQTSLNSYALHVDPRHATSLKSLCAAGQDTVRQGLEPADLNKCAGEGSIREYFNRRDC